MKSLKILQIGMIVVLLVFGQAAFAQVLDSCDQWGNYCSGDYCVYNNLWGSDAGPQCITAQSTTQWSIRSTQSGSGVKTYPNSSREMAGENVTIGSLSSCTSYMNVSTPGTGDFCTAWDIWAPQEVMIWMNTYGNVSPWGSYVETATIGGVSWDVYKNGYPGFVRRSNTNSMTVDIKAILDFCVSRGWLSSSGVIEKIQGGFEITSTGGVERTFTMNSYSVSYRTGSSSTSTTTTSSYTTTSSSSSGNIVVRARGVTGSERMEIRVNGSTVATYTVSTSYANYTASGSGTVRVAFTNDNGSSNDLQIDYADINGTRYQAENQATNTGVWQDSSCGGSYSEWLHCAGYIQFGSSSGGGATTSTASTTTTSSSSSGGGALGCGVCNWYGTEYPMCCVTQSGWGWEQSTSCISESTCNSQ